MPAATSTADLVFGAATATVSLDRIADGGRCVVVAVTGEMGVRRRLLEMGLCPGVEIEVVRHAPLGDPIEYLVRGYHLSLRAGQAAQVVVAERHRA
jgi:ferrous iron transport protein A